MYLNAAGHSFNFFTQLALINFRSLINQLLAFSAWMLPEVVNVSILKQRFISSGCPATHSYSRSVLHDYERHALGYRSRPFIIGRAPNGKRRQTAIQASIFRRLEHLNGTQCGISSTPFLHQIRRRIESKPAGIFYYIFGLVYNGIP